MRTGFPADNFPAYMKDGVTECRRGHYRYIPPGLKSSGCSVCRREDEERRKRRAVREAEKREAEKGE